MALPTFEIICVQCGASAVKYRTGGKPARYCGNACKIAAYRSANPERHRLHRQTEQAKRIPKPKRIKTIKQPDPKLCRECGAIVPKWKQYCEPCAVAARLLVRERTKQTESFKAAKRKAKARRRAIERGARAERFDPFEIFDRDGWRCHLCGIRTPKRLRGTYEDNAPELDHVVPLAAGGEHTRRNCACSCRRCNIAKADRPLGQLRLVT
jgi:hypothetical protein